MKSKPSQHNNDNGKSALDDIMNAMFNQAKARFGSAVKSTWFYDGSLCPGCQQSPLGPIKYKGKDAVAINAFIYRARGVLIGYFLCETCAKYIFSEAEKNPYRQTPLHADIERNLSIAYDEQRATLN